MDLLNQGFPLGFIGGTDTHSTMPAGFGTEHLKRNPGMTAVMTGALTRENVFRAIVRRDCYATSLERIWLEVEIAGASMGRIVDGFDAARPRDVRVSAAAVSEITSIDIVRNGETIHSTAPGDWRGSVAFTDAADLAPIALDSMHLGRFACYYVRVTCTSGAQAWSSPVWLCRF